MEYTLITLFSLSTLLLIISFFIKSQSKEVGNQIENYSITLMQEINHLKKKIKILEEAVLSGQDERQLSSEANSMIYDRDKILALYEEGHSLKKITELTGFSQQTINDILGR